MEKKLLLYRILLWKNWVWTSWSIWVLNFMLVYLISRKITDPSSLEEIIFHIMSSFSDCSSNELQGKCFLREQNRALQRKLVIFLISISENISFDYECNFKNNLITFIYNSLTKEFNLVFKSWKITLKSQFWQMFGISIGMKFLLFFQLLVWFCW